MPTLLIPEGWGDDWLSGFLHGAAQNVLAGFQHLSADFDYLRRISDVFRTAIDSCVSDEQLPIRMFEARSHAAFLGSVHLGLAGLLPEAYMVMRGCLEAALYGCHIAADLRRFDVWISRSTDTDSHNAVRKEFAIAATKRTLRELHPGTADIAARLYERLIDFGGHPNEDSLITQLEDTDPPNVVYLMTGEHVQYGFCLRTAKQVGVCALEVFRLSEPQRFDDLGISPTIDALKSGL